MLVIKNAKIFTSAQKVYEKGDILIESGKIKAIAESLETPEGAQIIDANGLTGCQRNDLQRNAAGRILLRNRPGG